MLLQSFTIKFALIKICNFRSENVFGFPTYRVTSLAWITFVSFLLNLIHFLLL